MSWMKVINFIFGINESEITCIEINTFGTYINIDSYMLLKFTLSWDIIQKDAKFS